MAKLTILAVVLVALLGLAHPSRTTITTTMVEEENPWQSQQRCREQMEREQQLHHCKMCLLQGRLYKLAMTNQQEHLCQCCQQMENIDEQCRCEAVRMMVRQQQGEWQGEEMQEMMKKAQDLPSRGNLRPHLCQIRAVWF